jgi:radical SAM superfamily enzyme YgiQ (UPF0313 family)
MLAFPPQSQPFLPHLAGPLLTAVLKKEGIDVVQRDFNLEAYEYFLTPEFLEKSGVPHQEAIGIEEVKQNLCTGKDFYSPSEYFLNIIRIQEYFQTISSNYEDLLFDLKNFDLGKYSTSSWDDIYNATFDRKSNIFIDFFEEKIKDISKESPRILGITVSWHNQIIPAFTLARLVKKHLPDIHVCMGGSMISHLQEFLQYKRKMFSIVDSFIPFDGESGIIELVKGVKNNDLKNVPGIIYPLKKKVISNKPQLCSSLDSLPTPDFEDLSLDKYYTAQKYLPVFASRGCYWAKCAFCSHHFSGSYFRTRSVENIFNDLNNLYDKYGCKNFYFIDDALPPSIALELSRMITKNNRPYRWAAEIRLENMMDESFFKELFSGGCRLLLFGLESANQRVLDSMNKGIKKETAENVIRFASQSGIITWVFFFMGFPGETSSEAKDTMNFLTENREYIDMIAGGNFILVKNSQVFKDPEKFNIKSIYSDKELDLQLSHYYETKEGMTKEESREVLKQFRELPESSKFLEYFVVEPHLLFFEKSYFTDKIKDTVK